MSYRGFTSRRSYDMLGGPVDVITPDTPLSMNALDVQRSFGQKPGDVTVPVTVREIIVQTGVVSCGTADGIRHMPETLVMYVGDVHGEKRALGSDYMLFGAPPTHTRHDGGEAQELPGHEAVLGQIRAFLAAVA